MAQNNNHNISDEELERLRKAIENYDLPESRDPPTLPDYVDIEIDVTYQVGPSVPDIDKLVDETEERESRVALPDDYREWQQKQNIELALEHGENVIAEYREMRGDALHRADAYRLVIEWVRSNPRGALGMLMGEVRSGNTGETAAVFLNFDKHLNLIKWESTVIPEDGSAHQTRRDLNYDVVFTAHAGNVVQNYDDLQIEALACLKRHRDGAESDAKSAEQWHRFSKSVSQDVLGAEFTDLLDKRLYEDRLKETEQNRLARMRAARIETAADDFTSICKEVR